MALQELLKRTVKNLVFPLTRIKPGLLILGAQKAGTTTLYEHLITHPQILPNRTWKEVRFFELAELYKKGYGWYLGNFPTRREALGRISVDASPGYLYFPQIPGRIHENLGDDIRMIAILRNPVERAYSAWKMYHSYVTNANVAENNRRIADPRSFSEAVNEEINGKASPDLYPYGYVGRGLYADQIENYYRVFDRRKLLFLDFRRLENDLSALLDDVTRFLEISPFTEAQKSQLAAVRHNQGLTREKSDDDREGMQTLRDFYRPHNDRLVQLLGWKLDS